MGLYRATAERIVIEMVTAVQGASFDGAFTGISVSRRRGTTYPAIDTLLELRRPRPRGALAVSSVSDVELMRALGFARRDDRPGDRADRDRGQAGAHPGRLVPALPGPRLLRVGTAREDPTCARQSQKSARTR